MSEQEQLCEGCDLVPATQIIGGCQFCQACSALTSVDEIEALLPEIEREVRGVTPPIGGWLRISNAVKELRRACNIVRQAAQQTGAENKRAAERAGY